MDDRKTCFRYEFGSFHADAVKRQLSRDGTPLPLTAKAFDTLLILLRRRGELVSKNDLMNSIWADTAVEENNLTQQISTLRKVLGERAGDHEFIVTIPGRGYSFVAPVREASDYDDPEMVLQEFTQSSITIDICGDNEGGQNNKTFRTRPFYFASTAFLLVVLAGAGWFYVRRLPSVPRANQTVAVLPFISLDGNDDSLGAGMSDTLTAKLGNLRNLSVRPTNTVIRYAGRDPLAAGRELKADAVLDGTIQRSGDQIRVTVKMLDVESGKVLWGQSFDRQFSDIFAVQDSISAEVAEVLQLHLSGDEQRGIRRHSTENVDAYQAYVRGRVFWNKRSEQSLNKGIEFFEQAVGLDPQYALAYSGIADSYLVLDFYDMSKLSHEETLQRAKGAVLKALEFDDSLSEAHTSLAFIHFSLEHNALAADTEFRRAIELDPNYATAHHWYSDFLTMNGRHDEAMRQIEIALELDPVSPIISTTMGERLFYARRYDEAITHLQRTIEMDDSFFIAHFVLGMVYEQKGMWNQAIGEFRKLRDLTRKQAEFEAVLGHAYARSGDRKQAREILNSLISESQYPHAIALIYTGLGDNKRAIEWLKKLDRSKSRWFLTLDPRLDSLRSDPEFQSLLNT